MRRLCFFLSTVIAFAPDPPSLSPFALLYFFFVVRAFFPPPHPPGDGPPGRRDVSKPPLKASATADSNAGTTRCRQCLGVGDRLCRWAGSKHARPAGAAASALESASGKASRARATPMHGGALSSSKPRFSVPPCVGEKTDTPA
jgi:hypothetical protein